VEVKVFAEEEAESLFRIWLGEETVGLFQQDLRALSERVERLPNAVAVAAEMLSRQFGPMGEEAKGLQLERLRNEVHDVPSLFQEALNSQGEREQQLLQAMAVCHSEGFWLPLAADIASLNQTESRQARDRLIQSSLLQVVDQNRQQFKLHALLREQIRKSLSLTKMNQEKIMVLKNMFADWESRWNECKECLSEIVPALDVLSEEGQWEVLAWLAYQGFATGRRVGELVMALGILKKEEQVWESIGGHEGKAALQRTYGNQALILKAWGQLEEALALHKKQEALCLELGNKKSLGFCYWAWGLVLRERGNMGEASEKLQAALAIFTELKMPKEREAVMKELERLQGES
jgi:tetratricopeptide (TPR) repeat protein